MSPDGVRAYKLLIEADVSLERFAGLRGGKGGSVRAAFSSGRLSKAMRGILHDLANGLQVDRMVQEAKKEEEHEEDEAQGPSSSSSSPPPPPPPPPSSSS